MVREAKGVIVALAICASLAASPAQGAMVGDIQLELFGGDVFWSLANGGGSVYDSELFVSEDESASPGKRTGQIRLVDDGAYLYEIRGGATELTPCELDGDSSYSVVNPFNPKIAVGDFLAGSATFSVTGSIWAVGETVTPEFAGGTILEGNVLYDFRADEREGPPGNWLNFQMQVQITGGELYAGATAGWVMQNRIILDTSLSFCQQPDNLPGGAVEDFLSDINYQTPGTVQIYPHPTIPEPISLGLLALGGVAVMRRRRRSVAGA